MPTATAPRRRSTRAAAEGVKPEGIITAIVAVTGVEDHVQDIIVPGAFTRTFKVRRPKVVFHHDWLRFLGRVLSVVELMPGDPRLPKRTKEGAPWPAAAGAVVAVMQMNMATEAGRDGYEWARFYTESNECEWSVGYKVVPGKASKGRDGIRYIADLDVYEFSLVLHGAASLSMTIDMKSAQQGPDRDYKDVALSAALDSDVIRFFEQQFEVKSARSEPEPDSAAAAVLEAKSLPVTFGSSAFDAVREAKAVTAGDGGVGMSTDRKRDAALASRNPARGKPVGPRKAAKPATARKPAVRAEAVPRRAAERPRSAAAGSFDESKHKRAPVGSPNGGQFIAKGSGYESTGRKDEAPDVTEAQRALIKAGLLGEKDGKAGKGDDGLFGRKTEAAVKKWQQKMGYKATGKLSGDQFDELTSGADAPEGEGGRGRRGEGGSAGRRRRSSAPDRYGRTNAPIKDRQGRPKYLDKAGTKVNPDYGKPTGQVEKRPAPGAKRPGPGPAAARVGKKKPGPAPSRTPKANGRPRREFGQRTSERSRLERKSAWDTITEARMLTGMEGKYDTSSLATAPGDADNWLEQVGEELDPFIRAVAHALMRERGKSKSDAIAIAIGRMKTWAGGGGDVTPKTRAKAAKAVAWWEKAKAKANATPSKMEGKSMYDMPGSYEAMRDQLRDALHDLFCKPNGNVVPDGVPKETSIPAGWVSIEATYPDHVIASYEPGEGTSDGYTASKRDTYRVPYTWTDGEVALGQPEPITLKVVAESTGSEADADDAAVARFADPAAKLLDDATALVVFGGAEGKAADVLRPAVLRLLDALAVKGMPDPLADDDEDDDEVLDGRDADPDDYVEPSPEPQGYDPDTADDDPPADLSDVDVDTPPEDRLEDDTEGKADDVVVLDHDEVMRQLAGIGVREAIAR